MDNPNEISADEMTRAILAGVLSNAFSEGEAIDVRTYSRLVHEGFLKSREIQPVPPDLIEELGKSPNEREVVAPNGPILVRFVKGKHEKTV